MIVSSVRVVLEVVGVTVGLSIVMKQNNFASTFHVSKSAPPMTHEHRVQGHRPRVTIARQPATKNKKGWHNLQDLPLGFRPITIMVEKLGRVVNAPLLKILQPFL